MIEKAIFEGKCLQLQFVSSENLKGVLEKRSIQYDRSVREGYALAIRSMLNEENEYEP